MTHATTGGPAFPQSDVLYEDGCELVRTQHGGMTLRDWFAGQAPITTADASAWCGYSDHFESMNTPSQKDKVIKALAWLRYSYADAMLAAREASE